MVNSTNSGAILPGLEYWLHHLIAVILGKFTYFSFLLCKMGIIYLLYYIVMKLNELISI